MRYLVVLHDESPVGAIYAAGNNDGFVIEGRHRHPVLDCTEIETSSPYYIFANRFSGQAGASSQSLFLPHGSVVVIVGYAKEEDRPVGFVRS